MLRYRILLFIIFFSQWCFAQKEDYIWIQRGPSLSIGGFLFDFNKQTFKPEIVNPPLGFSGNNASICDREGNLLFYSNGRAVIDRFHHVMPNGDSINEGSFAEKYWGGPFNGYPGSQDVLILPDPGKKNGYYLFHKLIVTENNKSTFRLFYTYMDITVGIGGDVIDKNKLYFDRDTVMWGFFTAMKHKNKQDWWIIQPLVNDSTFLTFLLDKNGINRMPDQNTHQYFDDFRSSAGGMAKFSPDGTKYALYTYQDQLHVYDFDRATGILSNHQKIVVFSDSTLNFGPFCGIEWSPSSRFIYTSSHRFLHQVDMWSGDPAANVTLIDKYNGTQDPFSTHINFMAQGPDCRIYVYPKNGTYSIHVINKPDELGKACDFVQNGIKLPYPNGNGTVPNFPRFRVDEVDKCDPTISSVFGESVYFRRKLDVFPSPSAGTYQIRMPDEGNDGFLMVTDLQGKFILKLEINNFQHIREIDISDQPSGRYNIDYYPNVNPDRLFYGRQVVKI